MTYYFIELKLSPAYVLAIIWDPSFAKDLGYYVEKESPFYGQSIPMYFCLPYPTSLYFQRTSPKPYNECFQIEDAAEK